MLNHCAHHTGGTFRPERHGPFTAILERVHFFTHHVGRLTDSAGEKRSFLEDWQLNVFVPGHMSLMQESIPYTQKLGGRRWHIVRHAFGCGKALNLLGITHGYSV